MQVVGIMLVHNEEVFLRRAAENVLGFCDRLLIAEHGSVDETPRIAEALARDFPKKVTVRRVQDARESQAMLAPYAGTPTWVLGVDGDELYDAAGLQETRRVLESGAWDRWWTVFGNALNCTVLEEATRTATGYMAPPCRSMTKLYNFAALEELDLEAPQRLMGRRDRFQPGYDASLRYELYKETAWEEAHFRCLHTCFLPRTRTGAEGAGGRANLTDLSKRPWWQRMLGKWAPPPAGSNHKQEKYRRGELVTVDAGPFLSVNVAR